MQEFKIVEYQASYAKAVADMWNCSSSVWNGRVFNSSEQKVLQEEGSSSYLNLYLAVIDDLVIGYAKFDKYAEEAGVSYIEMLGVVPEWHGKGVGKHLVQRCVLRAAELGYERIDLFTWAGNTKAVPLYKKCGFFWEKMESQATHLMNFIPGLLNNEFLRPYFTYFDWYNDTKRPLLIEPDGRQENGFEYYDYIWEKEDKKLQITFEKSGRGIVCIDTPDIIINSSTPGAKPIFGSEYPITYFLTNKTNKPIHIVLLGENDKEILFDYSFSDNLKETINISANYFIDPIIKERTEWESQHGVLSNFDINGKRIRFKTGLNIQYPLKTAFAMERNMLLPDREAILNLNIMNNFSQLCHYAIEFTEEEPLLLKKKKYEISLASHEKSSIPIHFSTKEACIFNPNLLITATPERGKKIEFTRKTDYPILTFTSKTQRILPDKYYLINSMYNFIMGQMEMKNWGSYRSAYGQNFNICPPQIGKPYSSEFDQELPFDVVVTDLGYANEMVVSYRSKEFTGVEFARVYKLYPSGLMECSVRIIKLPEQADDIYAKVILGISGIGLTFEEKGRLIRLEDDLPGSETDSFVGEEITGNWLFTTEDDTTSAMIWGRSWKFQFDRWWISFETNLSKQSRNGILETEPLLLFLDVFRSANQVRRYANETSLPFEPANSSLELLVNKGNPVLQLPYEIKLIEHKSENLRGTFTLGNDDILFPAIERTCLLEEEIRQIAWDLDYMPDKALNLFTCEVEMPLFKLKRVMAALHTQGNIRISSQDTDDNLLIVNNGLLEITAAKDARLPGLISLKFDGREWLDEAYPDYHIKSYYNPYPGGMQVYPYNIRLFNLLSEKHETSSASLTDQWGNKWEGIKIKTSIEHFEPLRGVVYQQYYVTLPGVPVLFVVPEIVTGDGYANYGCYFLSSFFKFDNKKEALSMRIPGENNTWQIVHAGKEAFQHRNSCRHIAIHCSASDYLLNIMTQGRTYHQYQLNPEIANDKLYLYSEFNKPKPEILDATCFIFSKDQLEHEWILQLLNTKFRY